MRASAADPAGPAIQPGRSGARTVSAPGGVGQAGPWGQPEPVSQPGPVGETQAVAESGLPDAVPLDPADPAFAADPFPFYEALSSTGSPGRVRLPNGRDAWFVTGHAQVREALVDPRLSARPPSPASSDVRVDLEEHMLNHDDPVHRRLRTAVSRSFGPTAVAELRGTIEALADGLLDEMSARQGLIDLVDAYAFPLPVLVMCEILGVPEEDRDALRGWTYTVSAPAAATSAEAVSDAWACLHGYFDDLIGRRAVEPGDDVLSALAAPAEGSVALTHREQLGMAFLLLFAGYETTMNLLAGGALHVLGDPATRSELAKGHLSWPDAVEELLRLVSPLEAATWRFAATDLDLGDASIRAGESVLLCLAAANRDEQAFPESGSFAAGREGAHHLAFGHGIHVCLGARLARLEAEIALSRLFSRFPHLRLAAEVETLPWRPGLLVRGPRRVPVRVDDPLARLRVADERRRSAGMRRTLTARRPNDGVLDLASNDYLGLSRDERVRQGAADAALTWGGGSTGSRLVTGTTALHGDLEQALAAHSGAGDALVLSSGYLANLATITALAPAGSLVVSDSGNHASIVDACRLARARTAIAAHLDVGAVEDLLSRRREPDAMVVTDAVFSVDGEAADLQRLAMACRRHGALLVVDEAHSFGVVGRGGRGAVWDAGLAGAPDVVVTATLSKALGSQGGAVLADPAVVEHLVNTARPFIFDTGLAPAAVGAAHAALEIVRCEPDLPVRARDVAGRIAHLATRHGLVASRPTAAVLSVRIGEPALAVAAAAECLHLGVRVGCFRPPSVPDADSRLRITARADLAESDLARLDIALAAVADLLGPRGLS